VKSKGGFIGVSTTHFGQRLRELREQAGLSQYALAKKAGLTKQALSHLELGVRGPVWETVQRLAMALGLDCRVFADESLELPAEEPARPRGRPKKVEAEAPKKQAKKKGR
jgi:transcriptional regulator with XRE-family HTH domain